MKCLPIILALFITSGIYAQDRIITMKSDTINCIITSEMNGNIYFKVPGKDSTQSYKSFLPLDQIQSIHRDNHLSDQSTKSENKAEGFNYPRTWVRLEGGYSRRLMGNTEDASNTQSDYYKQLKNGYYLGGSFTYFHGKTSGIGIKYSLDRSKVKIDKSNQAGGSNGIDVAVSDNIFINYFGLAYTARFSSQSNSNALFFRGSAGLVTYSNRVNFVNVVKINAQTFGTSLDFGYDLMFEKKIGISFGLGLSTGYYEKYIVTSPNGTTSSRQYQDGEGDNLIRINLSIGLVIK